MGVRRSDLNFIWERRWKARSDLLWLCQNVLDYTLVNEKVHGPMIRHLQQFPLPDLDTARSRDKILDTGKFLYTPGDAYRELQGNRRRVLLFSRGYFKTTCNTIAHCIQWLLNYPQLALALLFSVDSKAQDILKNSIKAHFQYNNKLRELFPEYCPQKRVGDWGNAESFTVENRLDVLDRLGFPPRVEPSVMAQSLDKGQAGYHFDLIKCSDIVEENNVQTPAQREQVKKRFGLLPKMLVKRPDGLDGWIDLEGTFYHPADLHSDMVKQWIDEPTDDHRWSIFINGVFERDTKGMPRKYDPWEMKFCKFLLDENGKRVPTWPTADPIDKLEKEEKDPLEGGYVFACTPGWGKILMADWTEKAIEDVQIGDIVIGYEQNQETKRWHLIKSTVLDKGSHVDDVVEISTNHNTKVYSTEDHYWWGGRTVDKSHHSPYHIPKIGRKIFSVYDPLPNSISSEEQRNWDWLAGMIDGEGHIDTHKIPLFGGGAANITITQSLNKNKPVCDMIEKVLGELDISYNIYERKYTSQQKWSPSRIYWLKGGRSMKIKLLNFTRLAKREQLIKHLWGLSRKVGQRKRGYGDVITSITPYSREEVYWLKTTTGNYVSQGYASKNTQRVLDISADTTGNRPFSDPVTWIAREDFKKVPIIFNVTTVDLADTDGPKSNYSVIATCGYDRSGRCYAHSIKRGRWGPEETVRRLFEEWREFRPIRVVIEDYAYTHGLKPTIDRECHMKNEYPPFQFVPADRTQKKIQRITNALQAPFKHGANGPNSEPDLRFVDPLDTKNEISNRALKSAVETEFSECTMFSTGSTDDILDALANQFLTREWSGKEGLGGVQGKLTPEAFQRLWDQAHNLKITEAEYIKARKRMIYEDEPQPKGLDPYAQTGW